MKAIKISISTILIVAFATYTSYTQSSITLDEVLQQVKEFAKL